MTKFLAFSLGLEILSICLNRILSLLGFGYRVLNIFRSATLRVMEVCNYERRLYIYLDPRLFKRGFVLIRNSGSGETINYFSSLNNALNCSRNVLKSVRA